MTRRLQHKEQAVASALLVGAILTTICLYLPATGGSLHFDDPPNLSGLSQVTDFGSAIAFIIEGNAGPLGRPIALATFVPHAHAWPHSPDIFLRTNILLHALNGALVAWVIFLIGALRGQHHNSAATTAAVTSALWLLLPILASSALLIVQRMTLLTAMFVLLGIVGYLYGRRLLPRRPGAAFVLMSLSVGLGTAFAALSKENGLLLPVYVLIIEVALLKHTRISHPKAWRLWATVFLVAPAILLLLYILSRAQYSDGVHLLRGFTLADRLLTQAHVLWKYLYIAFIPSPSQLGPFHDDQLLHSDWLSPRAILAVFCWFFAVVLAFVVRRRTTLPLFGVLWFLGGHALESFTIPLELYFEHRNYLPLIGPVYLIAYGALSLTARTGLLARVALSTYAVVLGLSLYSVTSLWGNPPLAAELWSIHRPDSARATQYLAGRLEIDGYRRASLTTLERFLERRPDTQMARVQVLTLGCVLGLEAEINNNFLKLKKGLAAARFDPSLVPALGALQSAVLDGACTHLDQRDVYILAESLNQNPGIRRHAVSYHNLQLLMARAQMEESNLAGTMRHLKLAMERHQANSTLRIALAILNSAGLDEAACQLLDDAQYKKPSNRVRRSAWLREMRRLRSDFAEQCGADKPVLDSHSD